MFDSTAVLVRWVDFESKDSGQDSNPHSRDRIHSTINKFELALAEIVRVVYECQNPSGGDRHFATLPTKKRWVGLGWMQI